MSQVSVVQRADGGVTFCPIVRSRGVDETEQEFLYACTRRPLMELLFVHLRQTLSIEQAAAAVDQHDKGGTLTAEAATIGVQVIGIFDAAEVPQKDIFRGAWRISAGRVAVDVNASKVIAHDKRRAARDEEFAPHDKVIALNIPGAAKDAAESAREAIRQKYAAMQDSIDSAATVDDIKAALR